MSRPGIPAWKRLGLKLKYANEDSGAPTSNGVVPPAHQDGQRSLKSDERSSLEPPRKKQKTISKSKDAVESSANNSDPPHSESVKAREEQPDRKVKKRVSFSADAKASSSIRTQSPLPDDSKAQKTSVKAKKSKKASSKTVQPLEPKSNTALEYLNQYHTARSKWKFNKNRETWILKHIFSEDDIPREYNLALARYIYGLQGAGARDRLKAQCMSLLEKGKDTRSGNDKKGGIAGEEVDAGYLHRFKDDLASSASSIAAATGDVATNPTYESWIQNQPRPMMLLWALGLDTNALVFTNKTEQKVKKRKNRTTVVNYASSSSSSDSESDSSSSSSSSSSDTDSDSDLVSGGKRDKTTGVSNGVEHEDETSSSGSDADSSSQSDSSTDDESEA
ncbi:hypothetical protein AYO21_06126 [Fonsecaea monophora]|uniref:WKF domain-containing protein n=1 Tax=Fonsecaea monophora TaxID=254056 RepID=A0A177F615_9EURO|nr:hypothetical protein AYO21_06126 [Fonsecaea monophora]OAG39658.1 hypothetical protein AYO21_06126 [Fonsecaea monophora]